MPWEQFNRNHHSEASLSFPWLVLFKSSHLINPILFSHRAKCIYSGFADWFISSMELVICVVEHGIIPEIIILTTAQDISYAQKASHSAHFSARLRGSSAC
jgi:hypothetical protein